MLDTHALLWWLVEPNRVPGPTRERIEIEPVWVCGVSAYELALKAQLGKLPEAIPVLPVLAETLDRQDVRVVEPGLEDYRLAGGLPLHHRDPFDRLLVAVALRRGLTVVTADTAIATYGVPTLWT